MDTLKSILLVEDDVKDIELTTTALSKHNLANKIMVARDGVEALDYLYRREQFAEYPIGDPVVILLDLKMPRMDGIQFIQHLKTDNRFKLIPIVVLTSSREDRDLLECYKYGVNAYIVKPVKFKEFVDAVEHIGIFWAILNEVPLTDSFK